MASFDYITVKEFRESLESDHNEIRNCFDAGAWKGVQVLSGSIVESLLVDYISSTSNAARPQKEPLKLDLAEAINICKSEGVISDRTADLCAVVRSYRNLIHPGRMVRLGEQAPDKNSATIAIALVGMISEEIAKVRRASVGLTAEQLLSKLQRDSNSIILLKHLLSEVNATQRERLLLDLIPNAHLAATNEDDPFSDSGDAERLESGYRIVLESCDTDTRKRVAAKFVRVLREDDGKSVARHGSAFFRPSDIKYVQEQYQPLVKEYFLGQIPSVHSESSLRLTVGIEKYLNIQDITKWLDPIVRTLVSTSSKPQTKSLAKDRLLLASISTSVEFDQAVDKRLADWVSHFKDQGASEKSAVIETLRIEVDAQNIPF